MIVVVRDPPSTMKGVLEMHLGHIESAINALNGGACTCGHVHTAEDDARFDPTLLGLAIERYIARAELDKNTPPYFRTCSGAPTRTVLKLGL